MSTCNLIRRSHSAVIHGSGSGPVDCAVTAAKLPSPDLLVLPRSGRRPPAFGKLELLTTEAIDGAAQIVTPASGSYCNTHILTPGLGGHVISTVWLTCVSSANPAYTVVHMKLWYIYPIRDVSFSARPRIGCHRRHHRHPRAACGVGSPAWSAATCACV